MHRLSLLSRRVRSLLMSVITTKYVNADVRCSRMKALLFILVRAFEFDLAVPASDVKKKQTIVQRTVIVSEPEAGNQMPLLIRPYHG